MYHHEHAFHRCGKQIFSATVLQIHGRQTSPVSHIFTSIKFFCCAWKWGKTVVTPGRLLTPTHTPWAIQGDAANPGDKLFIYMCHSCISCPAFSYNKTSFPPEKILSSISISHLTSEKKVIQIHRPKVRGAPRYPEHSFYILLLWSGDFTVHEGVWFILSHEPQNLWKSTLHWTKPHFPFNTLLPVTSSGKIRNKEQSIKTPSA